MGKSLSTGFFAGRGGGFLSRILFLRTDSVPGSLAAARAQIRQAVAQTGLTPEATLDMEIAVGEMLSNVHRHAYPSGTGPVRVEVYQASRTVTVAVIDSGIAVVEPVVPRTLPTRTEGGGWGLYLISRLADEVTFALNAEGPGLAVRVTKRVEGPRVQKEATEDQIAPISVNDAPRTAATARKQAE
jgi:anti-sigma regulatory factor (Ser/Thr protein kinase)